MTALTVGDVISVLRAFRVVIPRWLLAGFSVNLRDIGTLSPAIRCEGVDTPEEVSPNQIKRKFVRFRPAKWLLKQMSNLGFERMKENDASNGNGK